MTAGAALTVIRKRIESNVLMGAGMRLGTAKHAGQQTPFRGR